MDGFAIDNPKKPHIFDASDPDDVGRRVEEMVAKGKAIVQEALEEYKPIAVIAAFSGGNDSVVSTHFGCTEFGADALHCVTGIGVKKTREHARAVAEANGWKMFERKAYAEGMPHKFDQSILPGGKWVVSDDAYEEFVLNHGFPGEGMHPRMYQRLKERSFARMVAQIKHKKKKQDCVFMISGIRHDESAIRAGYKRAVQKQGSTIWVNPFYWQSKVDFEAYRQEFGIPRNPVSVRVGISGECLCGAFASDGEKELVRAVEPDTAAYIDNLESRVQSNGYPWCWGQGPPKWWTDQRGGQEFMFDMTDIPTFMPACVGCIRKTAIRRNANHTPVSQGVGDG